MEAIKKVIINSYKLETAIISARYKKSTIQKYDTKVLRLNKILAKLELIHHLKSFHSNGLNKYNINQLQFAITKLYRKLEKSYNTKKVHNIETKIKFLNVLLINCEILQNNKNQLLNSCIVVKKFI